jgi:hypothetical protein
MAAKIGVAMRLAFRLKPVEYYKLQDAKNKARVSKLAMVKRIRYFFDIVFLLVDQK